ncbi:hypothetical protein PRZ48_014862 [Zasmidium cellare]|uniref:Uncharacterized protein n=1 Tax=Zasmidium cellare TaxID=395010 RepID=A0ABR0DWX6_ZASCE|nr:hypothetical protein PRZ48_014862 [Zasmidium cellare]
MSASAPPPNAPTAPRGFRPPPLSGLRCRICNRPLDVTDKELCKHCQTQNAKPVLPATEINYNNEWGAWLGDDGEENQGMREGLEEQRRRMPNASQLEVVRGLIDRWDHWFNVATQEEVAKPAEKSRELPPNMACMQGLRRLAQTIENDVERERKSSQAEQDFQDLMKHFEGSSKKKEK